MTQKSKPTIHAALVSVCYHGEKYRVAFCGDRSIISGDAMTDDWGKVNCSVCLEEIGQYHGLGNIGGGSNG